MLEVDIKRGIFRLKKIWFSDRPYDVTKYDAVYFYTTKQRDPYGGFHTWEAPTIIIDLQEEEDTLWAKMSKKSCRYMIKRATREGIRIQRGYDFFEFLRFYVNFAGKKGFTTWKHTLKQLKDKGILFTAHLGEELLAGAFFLSDGNHIRWIAGASSRLEDPASKGKKVLTGAANRLLIWEAIRWAKNHNHRIFDLGGYYAGGNPDDPRVKINAFKKSFGGSLVTYYNHSKIYSPLYSIAKKIFGKKDESEAV